MTIYRFDNLSDGQAIAFNPNADVLNFGFSYWASNIRLTVEGANLRISTAPGPAFTKDVLLLNTSPMQLTTGNMTFDTGTRLLAGDNTTGTVGDNNANSLVGTDGNDFLIGFGGNDTLNGGLGSDYYVVGTGDVLVDSGGSDTVESTVSWTLGAGFENLTFTGTATTSGTGNSLSNVITGNSAGNWLRGLEGDDFINGGAGNDTINMSNGAGATYGSDHIEGGDGVDTLDYGTAARTGVVIDLAGGTATGGGTAGGGSATLISVENANGSAFADRLTGSAAANFLYGFDGNDTLDGGAGNDRLEGAAGNDQYVFSVAPGATNADTITGFATGADKILLDGSVHLNLGASGNFAAGDARFAAGAGFTSGRDASDRVVYNTTTGQLWYDSDGSGSGAAQLVATLQGAPAISATDIMAVGSSGASTTGTAGNDSLVGTAGNDTMDGLAGNDTLRGLAGNDSLLGGTGDDVVDGGEGNDTMDGGAGADHYFVNEGDVASDSGATGPIDTVHSFATEWTLDASTEALVLETGAIHGLGNESDNRIDASARTNNVFLWGDGGNDTLLGGSGNDGLDGGGGSDLLVGGDGADIFNEFFFGSGGDTLDGGLGNDTYYTFGSDVLVDAGGIDGIVTATSWTLAAGFENLSFVNWWDDHGIHGLEGYGNELDNFIDGFGGDGVLFDGREGNDTLSGSFYPDLFLMSATPGAANADVIAALWDSSDRIRLDPNVMPALGRLGTFGASDPRFVSGAGLTSGQDASDRVVYNTTTGDLYYDADGSGSGAALLIVTLNGAPSVVATNIEVGSGSGGVTYNGTAGDDSLNGTISDDRIDGLAGNDTVAGRGGWDTLVGGAGNDSLAGADVPFEEDRTGGDSLVGGDGDDTLDGWGNGWRWSAAFVDTLDGGLGNDVYQVDHPDDVLIDAGGVDTVRVDVLDFWVLGDGFENLSMIPGEGGGGIGIGNGLGNVMGTGQRASLEGRGGDDTMSGGFESWLSGEDGNDILQAELGTLLGGSGNDTLRGQYNEMTGGAGADRFSIQDGIVTDFSSGIDTLELDGNFLSTIGANGRFSSGDARFYAAPGATEAHDASDRVIYNQTTGNLYYDEDGSGSAAVAINIGTLQGAPTLVATDFDVINGPDSGGAVITGTPSSDSLDGTPGNDTMNGLGGNDGMDGHDGDDQMFGGDGDDGLSGGRGADTLDGGAGNDLLQADELGFEMGDWDDAIFGGPGNDTMTADYGTNTLDGGLGDDYYYVFSGSDVLSDAGGFDHVHTIDTSWTLGEGFENLDTAPGDQGGSMASFLIGNGLDNVIDANRTRDIRIEGRGGNDTLIGSGMDGRSLIHGGDGNDVIHGGHNTTVFGGAGNDIIDSSFRADVIDGGTGNDTLQAGEGDDRYVFSVAPGSANADVIVGFETVDRIVLDGSAMPAIGPSGVFAAGDARFAAGAGFTSGQDASDRVVYNTATGDLYYDADGNGAGAAQLIATLQGPPATFSATSIEVVNGTAATGQTLNGTANNDTLVGGAGNDTINGNAGADLIQGQGGNDSLIGSTGWDTIQGGDGNDWLHAGGWSDTMTGGAGSDSFVWNDAGTGTRDTVTDFASGTDELLFDNAFFAALGANSAWAAGDGRFWAAPGAAAGHDAEDRLVYNTSNGNLYYDADGSGAGAAQVVATFQGGVSISASDITVI